MLIIFSILGLFFQPLLAEDAPNVKSLAQQIERGMENAGIKTVVVLEFTYQNNHDGLGGQIIQQALIEALSEKGVSVFTQAEISSMTTHLEFASEPTVNSEEARHLARKLTAQSVVIGELKDKKNKLEVAAFLYETASGKVIGGGAQNVHKTWKDPVVTCGKMNYISLSSASYVPQSNSANIKIIFAEPWWPVKTIGRIEWNFCKEKGKNPNLNDALPALKEKTAEVGGQALQIKKSDLESENKNILIIEALVIH